MLSIKTTAGNRIFIVNSLVDVMIIANVNVVAFASHKISVKSSLKLYVYHKIWIKQRFVWTVLPDVCWQAFDLRINDTRKVPKNQTLFSELCQILYSEGQNT